ncbi:MAG: hypothetical protein K8T20_04235 [Planctomycetes bacterium]|nr:hypothetical protein [Planctomycetota bacterium]
MPGANNDPGGDLVVRLMDPCPRCHKISLERRQHCRDFPGAYYCTGCGALWADKNFAMASHRLGWELDQTREGMTILQETLGNSREEWPRCTCGQPAGLIGFALVGERVDGTLIACDIVRVGCLWDKCDFHEERKLRLFEEADRDRLRIWCGHAASRGPMSFTSKWGVPTKLTWQRRTREEAAELGEK